MKWLVLLLLCSGLRAEEVQVRGAVGVTGFLAIFGDGGYLSTGGAARFYLSQNWSIEPEYLYLRKDRLNHASVLCALPPSG